MICPNCGREIPQEKKFCGYCGHRLEPPEQSPRPEAPRPRHAPPPSAQDSPAQAGDAAAEEQREPERDSARSDDVAPTVSREADETQAAEGSISTAPSLVSQPAPSEGEGRDAAPAASKGRPVEREGKSRAAPEARVRGVGETRGVAKEGPMQKSPSPGLASSRRPRRWLIGIAGLVVLAVAGILIAPRLLGGGERALTAPIPTAQPQRATQPASAMQEEIDPTDPDPTPIQHQPTQAGAQFGDEMVLVSLKDADASVGAGQSVTLAIGWYADTPEQVQEFIDITRLTVSVDGELLDSVADYWGDVEEYEDADQDGDMDYISHWRYPLGILSPGAHLVESSGYLMGKISDGWDDFGPGQWLSMDLVIDVQE